MGKGKTLKDRFFGYEELLKNFEENEKYVKISALRYLKYGDTQTSAEGYNVPHCQDHLKNILIPPIYDTLSNISLASNL